MCESLYLSNVYGVCFSLEIDVLENMHEDLITFVHGHSYSSSLPMILKIDSSKFLELFDL